MEIDESWEKQCGVQIQQGGGVRGARVESVPGRGGKTFLGGDAHRRQLQDAFWLPGWLLITSLYVPAAVYHISCFIIIISLCLSVHHLGYVQLIYTTVCLVLCHYLLQTTLLVPGNYQGERTIVLNQVYDSPGKKRVKLPTVPVRTTEMVVVKIVDKNGLYFSDEFSLTFHMHYYKLLKWLVLLPMLAMFGMLVILRPHEGAPLPSFSRSADRLVCF